jgi:hypothetical protein
MGAIVLGVRARLEFLHILLFVLFLHFVGHREGKELRSGFWKEFSRMNTYTHLWSCLDLGNIKRRHCQRVRVGKSDAIRGCMEFT